MLTGRSRAVTPKAPSDRKLTPLETLIMNAVWDDTPASVKDVQERLKPVKPMARNTVLTMMRILRDKGFLASRREGRADLYRPTVTREDVGRRSVSDLINSLFSGSAEALVSQLLDGQTLSDDELTAIRAELDKTLERRKGEGS
jgi:BlaI family transcriptional regulator, penicillinase repressor